MTPSELYSLHFQNSDPKFFSMMPHILDHLTYDEIDLQTGNKVIKRLSIFAIQLYRIIKIIAGEHGACWQNRDKLAELANMSTGSISKAKEELQKNFHQLDGNSLIKLEEVKKSNSKNGTTYHRIIIQDIWRWNNAFMGTLNIRRNEAPSPNDGAKPAPSPNDGAPQTALSPGDTNNNNANNTPLSKEQQPVDNVQCPMSTVCSLNQESIVPPAPPDEVTHRTEAFNGLMRIGFEITAATYLSENNPPEDLINAAIYYQKQKQKRASKGEEIKNPPGCYRDILKKRYWEKK